jgi:tetratricopeptide (TPR) repeat protein
MSNISLRRALAGAALAGLFVAACSTANKNLNKQTSIESRKSLESGDFEKALAGFKAALKENPRNKELTANYIRTVEEVKRTADIAMGRRDYARAGDIYQILVNSYPDFEAFAAKLPFKEAQLAIAQKACRAALVEGRAQQALKAGKIALAIETFQGALSENPGDADLKTKYLGTLEEIKAIGDNAYHNKDFARAGLVSFVLLKNYSSYEGLRPPVALTRESLQETIAACREALTKTGLTEYRKGNLAKAIAVWEGLLAFDPDNAEIKKAVTTAKTQLNELIKKK